MKTYNDDLIIYFVQRLIENQETEPSLKDMRINPNRGSSLERLDFSVNNTSGNGISLDESQSKQIIISTDFYSRMDVIYTVKKYFDQKYKFSEQKQSDSPDKNKKENRRNLNDEI